MSSEDQALDGCRQEYGAEQERGALSARFLTLNQTALVLNVSYATVYRNVKSRKWPSMDVGRKPLVPVAFIEKLEMDTMASVSGA